MAFGASHDVAIEADGPGEEQTRCHYDLAGVSMFALRSENRPSGTL
jgi:hypothetical protein